MVAAAAVLVVILVVVPAADISGGRSSSVVGHAVAQLVEALRYKSEGRGFDSRWCHRFFSLT